MPTSKGEPKKVTQAELDAEIEKQVQERLEAKLKEHNIDQSPTDLAAALTKLAEVMDKQGTVLEQQAKSREELIAQARNKTVVEKKMPWNDTESYNIMAEARAKAEKLGYQLGPWRAVKQDNASPKIQSYPFWYAAHCVQTGARAEVRWNPPSLRPGGGYFSYWYPSMYGPAVSRPRHGKMTMVERWARAKGMPFATGMEVGGGMAAGGVAVPHAVDGVHDN